MQIVAQTKVLGAVTSLSLTADGTYFFAGTNMCNMYWCDTDKLAAELRNTCHYTAINQVVFPYNYSDVFATSSVNDIRIWNAKTRQELLRIQVPNMECYALSFMHDGKSIVSGWSDGQIRAFLPQSGKLFYVINNAHMHGTTALATTSDSARIISGGMEGEVRVWKIGKQTQIMEASLKEHRGRVNDIQVNKTNSQALSASADGSIIVWDLTNFTRAMCLFEKTMFKQVCYHPDESQILTAGSDHKIAYWDGFDGQQIRNIEASEAGINALNFINDDYYLTGGDDKMLMLWKYDEALSYYKGEGHPGSIKRIAVSPNKQFAITGGSEGAIFFWNLPEEIFLSKEPQ